MALPRLDDVLTAQTQFAGSRGYRAPDVAWGAYCTKVDCWSLGVILFEMVSERFENVGFAGNSERLVLLEQRLSANLGVFAYRVGHRDDTVG